MSNVVSTDSIVAEVQAKFNFSVDKFPLGGPDGLQTPWYGLFRSDTNQVVGNGSVTRQYVPHTTDDVVALVEAASAAFEGVTNVRCFFRDGHYVFMEPKLTMERRAEIYANDIVIPKINLAFGYDQKACKASFSVWRITCANLFSMRSVRESVVSFRHMSNLRSNMQELIDTFGVLGESWGDIVNTMERMESNRVNLVSFLNSIYGEAGDSKRAVTIHRERTADIVQRLLREQTKLGRTPMADDFMVSGWEAYNAVQGYIQHDVTRKGRNKANDDAQLLLSLNAPEVYKAEHLALAV